MHSKPTDRTSVDTQTRLRSFAAGLWTTVGFAGIALALAMYGVVAEFGRKRESARAHLAPEEDLEQGSDKVAVSLNVALADKSIE